MQCASVNDNGNITRYVYDDLNRLIQQTTLSGASTLTDFQYTLDAASSTHSMPVAAVHKSSTPMAESPTILSNFEGQVFDL